ncbi:MAG: hypothetical protein J1D88_09540 [Treponema sp.]|nr:hypothetical protein [Treponema sp.]
MGNEEYLDRLLGLAEDDDCYDIPEYEGGFEDDEEDYLIPCAGVEDIIIA